MANPFQEYKIARSMPIQALAAVLRGVSDMVSLGVAHAALKEKMEAEVAKKGMQAMQSAQAPKVKDKDLAMAQGLASTPADINVPMGGIVGGEGTFGTGAAGGGSVVAFQEGGQPSLQTVLNQMSLQERMDYQRSGRLPERFRQMLAGETQMPEAAPRGPGRGTTFTEALQDQGMGATPLSTDTMAYYPGMGPLIQRQAAVTQPSPLIDYSKADMGLVRGSSTDPGVATESITDFEKRMAAKEKPGGGIADLATEQAQVAQPVSFEAVTNQAKELAKKYKTDPGTTKDFTAFSKEYVDTLKEAGYDFDLVKDNIRKLAEEKEALKGEKKEAANLRLLEAGLGILGGESPYAFVNIGKGATPALQGLAKDLKEIKKTRRELNKETMQLNLLQNQMAEGKVKYAQGRLDKQEERQAKAAEKNAEIEFRIADRLSSNSIQKYVADRQFATSSTNLQATQLEREAKRADERKEVALKQAAEEFKMETDTPEKRRKVLTRAGEILQALEAENFGANAASGNVLRFDAQGNPIK